MRVIVSQIGAREHYAVARALHRQRMLAGLVTDWYAPGNPVFRRIGDLAGRCLGGRSRSAFAAYSAEIPVGLVRAFSFRSLLWKWRVRRLAAQGRSHDAYVQTDGAFASAVARLKLPPHGVFFGYSYASLEAMEIEKKRGVFIVLDQIDPGAAEFRWVSEEMSRFPQLAGPSPEFPGAYYERNRREWELADVILVNSEWSREALILQGVPPEKLEVIPLCFERGEENVQGKVENRSKESHIRHSVGSPLRVLWLGQVNVRKGIHYLMEAARLLEGESVRFDVVGSVAISEEAVKSAPANMTFHGSVSRDRAAEWYRQSDLFVLPTLSDGFALTQLEAMAHGLPVITTPNCGRVVVEGGTGFLVAPRDAQALADAVLRFARSPGLALEMAPACRESAKVYSIDAYGERLAGLLEQHNAVDPLAQ